MVGEHEVDEMDAILLEERKCLPVDVSEGILVETHYILVSSPALCLISGLLRLHYETCQIAIVLLAEVPRI